MKNLTRKLNQIVAVLTAIQFVITSAVWAAPTVAFTEVKLPALAETLRIPSEIGTVNTRHARGVSSGTIIHIQDAHGSMQAQEHIKELIQHVTEAYDIDLVFVEGSTEELRPEMFTFFQNSSLDQQIIPQLVRDNLMGGPEWYVAEKGTGEVLTYGVEEASLYHQNLLDYQAVYQEKHKTDEFLAGLKSEILTISSHVMNKKLKAFFREWMFYQDVPTELMRQLNTLKTYADQELSLDLTNSRRQIEWPQLVRILKLQELEGQQDKAATQEELEKLKEWMEGNTLDASMVEDLTNRTQLEKFYEMTQGKGFKFEDYPHLSIQWAASIIQHELQAHDFMKEIRALTQLILKALTQNDQEREMVQHYENYLLLKDLFALELTYDDFTKLAAANSATLPSTVAVSLFDFHDRVLGSLHHKNNERRTSIKKLADQAPDMAFKKALTFYEIAQERETAFTQNMISKMKEHNKANAILVTGGFHAEGMAQHLRDQGISYAQVSPVINQIEDGESYTDAMMLEGDYLTLRSHRKPDGLSMNLGTHPNDQVADAVTSKLLRVTVEHAVDAARSGGNAYHQIEMVNTGERVDAVMRSGNPVLVGGKALAINSRNLLSTIDPSLVTGEVRSEARAQRKRPDTKRLPQVENLEGRLMMTGVPTEDLTEKAALIGPVVAGQAAAQALNTANIDALMEAEGEGTTDITQAEFDALPKAESNSRYGIAEEVVSSGVDYVIYDGQTLNRVASIAKTFSANHYSGGTVRPPDVTADGLMVTILRSTNAAPRVRRTDQSILVFDTANQGAQVNRIDLPSPTVDPKFEVSDWHLTSSQTIHVEYEGAADQNLNFLTGELANQLTLADVNLMSEDVNYVDDPLSEAFQNDVFLVNINSEIHPKKGPGAFDVTPGHGIGVGGGIEYRDAQPLPAGDVVYAVEVIGGDFASLQTTNLRLEIEDSRGNRLANLVSFDSVDELIVARFSEATLSSKHVTNIKKIMFLANRSFADDAVELNATFRIYVRPEPLEIFPPAEDLTAFDISDFRFFNQITSLGSFEDSFAQIVSPGMVRVDVNPTPGHFPGSELNGFAGGGPRSLRLTVDGPVNFEYGVTTSPITQLDVIGTDINGDSTKATFEIVDMPTDGSLQMISLPKKALDREGIVEVNGLFGIARLSDGAQHGEIIFGIRPATHGDDFRTQVRNVFDAEGPIASRVEIFRASDSEFVFGRTFFGPYAVDQATVYDGGYLVVDKSVGAVSGKPTEVITDIGEDPGASRLTLGLDPVAVTGVNVSDDGREIMVRGTLENQLQYQTTTIRNNQIVDTQTANYPIHGKSQTHTLEDINVTDIGLTRGPAPGLLTHLAAPRNMPPTEIERTMEAAEYFVSASDQGWAVVPGGYVEGKAYRAELTEITDDLVIGLSGSTATGQPLRVRVEFVGAPITEFDSEGNPSRIDWRRVEKDSQVFEVDETMSAYDVSLDAFKNTNFEGFAVTQIYVINASLSPATIRAQYASIGEPELNVNVVGQSQVIVTENDQTVFSQDFSPAKIDDVRLLQNADHQVLIVDKGNRLSGYTDVYEFTGVNAKHNTLRGDMVDAVLDEGELRLTTSFLNSTYGITNTFDLTQAAFMPSTETFTARRDFYNDQLLIIRNIETDISDDTLEIDYTQRTGLTKNAKIEEVHVLHNGEQKMVLVQLNNGYVDVIKVTGDSYIHRPFRGNRLVGADMGEGTMDLKVDVLAGFPYQIIWTIDLENATALPNPAYVTAYADPSAEGKVLRGKLKALGEPEVNYAIDYRNRTDETENAQVQQVQVFKNENHVVAATDLSTGYLEVNKITSAGTLGRHVGGNSIAHAQLVGDIFSMNAQLTGNQQVIREFDLTATGSLPFEEWYAGRINTNGTEIIMDFQELAAGESPQRHKVTYGVQVQDLELLLNESHRVAVAVLETGEISVVRVDESLTETRVTGEALLGATLLDNILTLKVQMNGKIESRIIDLARSEARADKPRRGLKRLPQLEHLEGRLLMAGVPTDELMEKAALVGPAAAGEAVARTAMNAAAVDALMEAEGEAQENHPTFTITGVQPNYGLGGTVTLRVTGTDPDPTDTVSFDQPVVFYRVHGDSRNIDLTQEESGHTFDDATGVFTWQIPTDLPLTELRYGQERAVTYFVRFTGGSQKADGSYGGSAATYVELNITEIPEINVIANSEPVNAIPGYEPTGIIRRQSLPGGGSLKLYEEFSRLRVWNNVQGFDLGEYGDSRVFLFSDVNPGLSLIVSATGTIGVYDSRTKTLERVIGDPLEGLRAQDIAEVDLIANGFKITRDTGQIYNLTISSTAVDVIADSEIVEPIPGFEPTTTHVRFTSYLRLHREGDTLVAWNQSEGFDLGDYGTARPYLFSENKPHGKSFILSSNGTIAVYDHFTREMRLVNGDPLNGLTAQDISINVSPFPGGFRITTNDDQLINLMIPTGPFDEVAKVQIATALPQTYQPQGDPVRSSQPSGQTLELYRDLDLGDKLVLWNGTRGYVIGPYGNGTRAELFSANNKDLSLIVAGPDADREGALGVYDTRTSSVYLVTDHSMDRVSSANIKTLDFTQYGFTITTTELATYNLTFAGIGALTHAQINLVPDSINFLEDFGYGGDAEVVMVDLFDGNTHRAPGAVDVPMSRAISDGGGLQFRDPRAIPSNGVILGLEVVDGDLSTLDAADIEIHIKDNFGDTAKKDVPMTSPHEVIVQFATAELAANDVDELRTVLVVAHDKDADDGRTLNATFRIHVRPVPREIFSFSTINTSEDISDFNFGDQLVSLGNFDDSRARYEAGLITVEVNPSPGVNDSEFAGGGPRAFNLEVMNEPIIVDLASTAGETLNLEFKGGADKNVFIQVQDLPEDGSFKTYAFPAQMFLDAGMDHIHTMIAITQTRDGGHAGDIFIQVEEPLATEGFRAFRQNAYDSDWNLIGVDVVVHDEESNEVFRRRYGPRDLDAVKAVGTYLIVDKSVHASIANIEIFHDLESGDRPNPTQTLDAVALTSTELSLTGQVLTVRGTFSNQRGYVEIEMEGDQPATRRYRAFEEVAPLPLERLADIDLIDLGLTKKDSSGTLRTHVAKPYGSSTQVIEETKVNAIAEIETSDEGFSFVFGHQVENRPLWQSPVELTADQEIIVGLGIENSSSVTFNDVRVELEAVAITERDAEGKATRFNFGDVQKDSIVADGRDFLQPYKIELGHFTHIDWDNYAAVRIHAIVVSPFESTVDFHAAASDTPNASPVVVDDQAATYTGQWATSLEHPENPTLGDAMHYSFTTSVPSTATFSLISKPGEVRDVYVTHAPALNRTQKARFSVDGVTNPQTVLVDQTAFPDDLTTPDGTKWEFLGRYTANGAAITVTLTNQNDNTQPNYIVIADGAMSVLVQNENPIVDDQDATYTGQWATSLEHPENPTLGDAMHYSFTTSVPSTATFSLISQPGEVRDVYVTHAPALNRTKQARFSVGGVTQPRTVFVDQTAFPGDLITQDQTRWVHLGRYTATGGAITVTLTNQNDNTQPNFIVIADGAMSVKVDPELPEGEIDNVLHLSGVQASYQQGQTVSLNATGTAANPTHHVNLSQPFVYYTFEGGSQQVQITPDQADYTFDTATGVFTWNLADDLPLTGTVSSPEGPREVNLNYFVRFTGGVIDEDGSLVQPLINTVAINVIAAREVVSNLDVNGDGVVSPIDVLLIINRLNQVGGGPFVNSAEPPYYDVSGDEYISPVDALHVINFLNNVLDGTKTVSNEDFTYVPVSLDTNATITVNDVYRVRSLTHGNVVDVIKHRRNPHRGGITTESLVGPDVSSNATRLIATQSVITNTSHVPQRQVIEVYDITTPGATALERTITLPRTLDEDAVVDARFAENSSTHARVTYASGESQDIDLETGNIVAEDSFTQSDLARLITDEFHADAQYLTVIAVEAPENMVAARVSAFRHTTSGSHHFYVYQTTRDADNEPVQIMHVSTPQATSPDAILQAAFDDQGQVVVMQIGKNDQKRVEIYEVGGTEPIETIHSNELTIEDPAGAALTVEAYPHLGSAAGGTRLVLNVSSETGVEVVDKNTTFIPADVFTTLPRTGNNPDFAVEEKFGIPTSSGTRSNYHVYDGTTQELVATFLRSQSFRFATTAPTIASLGIPQASDDGEFLLHHYDSSCTRSSSGCASRSVVEIRSTSAGENASFITPSVVAQNVRFLPNTQVIEVTTGSEVKFYAASTGRQIHPVFTTLTPEEVAQEHQGTRFPADLVGSVTGTNVNVTHSASQFLVGNRFQTNTGRFTVQLDGKTEHMKFNVTIPAASKSDFFSYSLTSRDEQNIGANESIATLTIHYDYAPETGATLKEVRIRTFGTNQTETTDLQGLGHEEANALIADAVTRFLAIAPSRSEARIALAPESAVDLRNFKETYGVSEEVAREVFRLARETASPRLRGVMSEYLNSVLGVEQSVEVLRAMEADAAKPVLEALRKTMSPEVAGRVLDALAGQDVQMILAVYGTTEATDLMDVVLKSLTHVGDEFRLILPGATQADADELKTGVVALAQKLNPMSSLNERLTITAVEDDEEAIKAQIQKYADTKTLKTRGVISTMESVPHRRGLHRVVHGTSLDRATVIQLGGEPIKEADVHELMRFEEWMNENGIVGSLFAQDLRQAIQALKAMATAA